MPFTKLEIIEIAQRYTVKSKFRLKHPSEYLYASRQGWLEDVTGHMVRKDRTRKNTKAVCRAEAKLYNTRNEFREGSHSIYITAHREGWLDDICKHMACGYELRSQNN